MWAMLGVVEETDNMEIGWAGDDDEDDVDDAVVDTDRAEGRTEVS
jgi:hypothetical protein